MAQTTRHVQRIVSRQRFNVRHSIVAGCEFQPHSHTVHTVTAVLGGALEAVIGNESAIVEEGDCAFTSAGATHSARASKVEFVSVGIGIPMLDELVAELGLVSGANEAIFRSSVVRDEYVNVTARAIAGEVAEELIGQAAMLEALVRQLGIHLLRNHIAVRGTPRIELSRAGAVDRRIRRALEFIHDNYSRDLSLGEIASAAYLSEYHFARLFKQITGAAPHAYLANLRIERARQLLVERTLTINEVAAAVGYQSQSHFTRVFKAITGLTPGEYRNSSV
jgi:AraC family transcriptional regulator